MSNRTTESYKSVFEYINENVISLGSSTIITDFERALRNAVKAVFCDVKILGCWFHHCQALRRMMASIPNLFHLIQHENDAKLFYRKIQCLALLPPNKIKPAFDQIAYEALKKYPQFEKFIKYYDSQWIKRETPDSYSVFLQVSLAFLLLFK